MAPFSSSLFKQLHRLLVHLRMAPLVFADYRNDPYPYSLTALTERGTLSISLSADRFFGLLETEPRADLCFITKICTYKEYPELSPWNHEFLVVEIMGPDGNTNYNLRFERTGPEELNHGQNDSSTSALPSGSDVELKLVSSHSRPAAHAVTVFPSSQIQPQAGQNAYVAVTHEYNLPQPPSDEPTPSPSPGQSKGRAWMGAMKTSSKAAFTKPEGTVQSGPARLTLRQFACLARSTMSSKPHYNITDSSCYWLTAAMLKAVDKVLQYPASTHRIRTTTGQAPAGHIIMSGSVALGPVDRASDADVEKIVELYRAKLQDPPTDPSDYELYRDATLLFNDTGSQVQHERAVAIRAARMAEQAKLMAVEAEQTANEAARTAAEAREEAERERQRADEAERTANEAEQTAALDRQRADEAERTANEAEQAAAEAREEAERERQRADRAEERISMLEAALKAHQAGAAAAREGATA